MNGIPNEDVVRLIDRAMSAEKNDNRSRGRMRCNNVDTSIGPVLDFSATGMRVLSKREIRMEEGQNLLVDIESAFDPVTVPVAVKWSRKLGWRRYETGVQFVDLTDEAKAVLAEIARSVPVDLFCMIHSMNRRAS